MTVWLKSYYTNCFCYLLKNSCRICYSHHLFFFVQLIVKVGCKIKKNIEKQR